MGRFKAVHTDPDKFAITVEWKILQEADIELHAVPVSTEEQVIDVCKEADAILTVRAPITAKVAEALERCQIIARYGIGVDNIDLDACTKNGIYVANVPDACIDEVADHCLALMLALWRKIVPANAICKAKGYDRLTLMPIHRVRGHVWGLIGFGKIARAVSVRAQALGMKVIAYDPYLPKEVGQERGVELTSLEEVLRRSDVISVHVPLTPETHHLIGQDQLRLMKKTAYIINVARGKVMDGKALYKALKEGWIAGAGLDVMEKEPPDEDDPLLLLEDKVLLMTPHMGGYSEESWEETRERCAQAVVAVLSGKEPQGLLNPEARQYRKVKAAP